VQLHVSYRGERLLISFTPRADYPRGRDRDTLEVWVDLGADLDALEQYFSTSVRPWPGKLFFYKTRTRSQQIYS